MKKLLMALMLVVSLTSCALYGDYTSAGFDANEYALINRIRTQSELAGNCSESKQCYIAAIHEDYKLSVEFENYAADIPHNKKVAVAASDFAALVKQSQDTLEVGKFSSTFAQLKFAQIEKSASDIQKAIGELHR